ncbi:autotransporter outer membrane beta-barrel domain-containing protein [Alcaligenes parafaecalis]|uniref:Autotransporter domain-containing protein n=1 Tax=Alcaligenes parafaecalis TaxID=171260 RepID=A0ABT3VQF5_9BURK|nr:autotransporter outer membrane beta-barrel domain-containing protein [Alcaligenes parafaecalis]MCX5465729.1 autotransporter domain-containing protein [Alcaligenes parafaecalis]
MDVKIKALLGPTLLALSWANSIHAYTSEFILNKQGQRAFELRTYGPNDRSYDLSSLHIPQRISPRNIDENGRMKIRAALDRWAEILNLPQGYTPAVINLGTMNVQNANAYGTNLTMPSHPNLVISALQARLAGLLRGAANNPDAVIGVGTLDLDSGPVTPSQLPLTRQVDYSAVIFHELAHALGIGNTVENRQATNTSSPAPYFRNVMTPWALSLRDDHGRAASPGQRILCSVCSTSYDPRAFDLRQDKGYFTGNNVQAVLNGAMPGLPVSILRFHEAPRYGVDTDYMAHIELRNSLMSHQTYRNYVNLMEAEIAALQDIGLNIDRRNFFGYSVYNNGITLNNTNGYFARNKDKTGYLPGQYNTATQGLGLHIYGERNTIIQSADLLSAGPGGIGVRIDGSENTLIIPKNTRIHAHGWYGRGLQLSYGRHHNIIQQGEVRASGVDGIGVLFDFGQNAMGNDNESRGSWWYQSKSSPLPMPEALKGALISNYNLSGVLSGQKAAIYIAENAWVNNINIMQGAQITGDITSAYNRRDANQKLLLTNISFGLKANEFGQASNAADPNFQLRYDGNINGPNNLFVVIAGGVTSLNGKYDVYGMRVNQGATLSGNAQLTVNREYNLTNNGTISPGNSYGSLTIEGNFIQGPEGRILVEASPTQNDHLDIQGVAQLDGELQVVLQPDWYQNGWTLNQDKVFTANQTQGQFTLLSTTLASPTLGVEITSNNWTVGRKQDAYAQYATSPNAAAVGTSLAQASSGNQSLAAVYQALDFSRADGSDIGLALDQLSAGAYAAQTAASLRREQLVSEQLRQTDGINKSGWQSFIQTYGGRYHWQLGSNDVDHRSETYGVMLGAEHRAEGSDWSLGVHGNANEQRVNVDAPFQAKSKLTGLGLGVHARYRGYSQEGWNGLAQLRVGIEQGKMNRNISFSGYQARPSSDWTGHTFSLGVQTGYNWALGENGSIGPVLALDYLHYRRPGLEESGDAASRLHLDSSRQNALQASIGLALRQNWNLSQDRQLQTSLSVAWEQALLSRNQTQEAAFASAQSVGFDGRYARVDRHALSLGTSINLQQSERLRLGLSASTRLLDDSRADINGKLFLNWMF